MENSSKQMENRKEGVEEKKGKLEGLPMESSPYLKYTDLEDYKRIAYGTGGHQEVRPNQGGAELAESLSMPSDTIDKVQEQQNAKPKDPVEWVSRAMHAHKQQKSRPHLFTEETQPASQASQSQAELCRQRELERKTMVLFMIIATFCVLLTWSHGCRSIPIYANKNFHSSSSAVSSL
ncbi:hypothetical protein SADUNF_Sadunf02G0004200 [Salix dunnii]|uniref:Uncharacterized protein n=1 Tax=Salix dunnii TaxID=1413687 RepID=A0A835THX0_9ROSI|nr:hypothetical protein SADUNF_Sadunf02G0004200 [Salix dunnii]